MALGLAFSFMLLKWAEPLDGPEYFTLPDCYSAYLLQPDSVADNSSDTVRVELGFCDSVNFALNREHIGPLPNGWMEFPVDADDFLTCADF